MKKEFILLVALVAVVGLAAQSCKSATNYGEQDQATNEESNTGTSTERSASTSPGSTGTTTTAKTVTISYDGSKFSPATVNIKVGDTVKFVNQSSLAMWVGSDPHPSHSDLPGFDSKASVGKGASYSYKFTTAGTFGYHNHLYPNQEGTVVVTQ